MNNKEIKRIADAFGIKCQGISFTECNIGHINSTYFVKPCADNSEQYVFQRLNTEAFKRPDELMSNLFGITEHIKKKFAAKNGNGMKTLDFLRTADGKLGYTDESGAFWRVYRFVPNAHSINSTDSLSVLERSGFAFGNFQKSLSDFDASTLYETIPSFHNTESRLESFKKAVAEDTAGRLSEISREVEFVLSRADKCSYITEGIRTGKFPLRVTHNDTKLNNLLWDDTTGECLCVIDLDTVMPGSVLYDFGDLIRFGASSAAEDETDLSRVYTCIDKFEAYVKGFIKGTDGVLTNDEILAFPMGAYVITLETGIRFLTDYLNGDTYFRIHYPTHNLDRAKNQFRLVESMEEKMSEMNKITERYIK